MSDVSFDRLDAVAIVELHRPPHNFFDHRLVAELADVIETARRSVAGWDSPSSPTSASPAPRPASPPTSPSSASTPVSRSRSRCPSWSAGGPPDLFFRGRRINGEEATRISLADECVEQLAVRNRAVDRAEAIATSAPLAVRAVKATLDLGRDERLRAATDRELSEQARLMATNDAKEGVRASIERRTPTFRGR